MAENKITIDLNKVPFVICECGNPFFTSKILLKRIPGLMAGQANDLYHKEPVLVCDLCGCVNKETTPLKDIPSIETKGQA
jgi:hypothetical protein